ncbi:MAG: 2,3-dihydroxybiphenyl 1,2-dioxygenase [Acidimicrobiales bacterium]|nr:MAG: 2,3-dihydroxybiphenyl 1,2-dioxygenase [Acidimicrobiales bacterium]
MSNLSLGYIRVRTPNLDAWDTFGAEVLGFMPTGGPDEASRYFRWDDHPYRLHLEPGDEPELAAIGWEAADDLALDALVDTLEASGINVTRGTDEEAAARLVTGFASFTDPAGAPVEIFCGPVFDHERVITPLVSGFVTGEMGFGHVVTSVENLQDAVDFYRGHLGFHLRNTWDIGIMEMAFLSPNPRHHSLAFGAGMPGSDRLRHFMVEAATIDDVGYAQDRCIDAGVPVIMGLGRHTNDHMLSFYCKSPDGFLVEFGWGGLQVDDPADLPMHQITKPSIWGHRPILTNRDAG